MKPMTACFSMSRFGMVLLCLLLIGGAVPAAYAADDTETLRRQMEQLQKQMQGLQEKLDQMEAQKAEQGKSTQEITERLDKAELHTATDKIAFGVELRTRAESIHYNDVQMAPVSFLNMMPSMINSNDLQTIHANIGGAINAGLIPDPESVEVDNDIVYTNRLRLEMKAKVNDQLTFGGRLAMYKVFGDSTGVKFNQGSLSDVTFDGNTTSLPHGDILHVERAYFNYRTDLGSVPTNFSVGRRPSTEGPPLEYRNFSLEGGSPLAPLINWQFDGASLNFGLEEVTGIPGASLKLCYGVGFESDYGNAASLASSQPDVEDVHMYGLIAEVYNDDVTRASFTYAHASDITDGFTGMTVMPFIVSKDSGGTYSFSPNTGGYVSRIEPMTNIGDWDGATLLLRTNLAEKLADIDLFLAGSWSHTNPSRVSRNPFYEIMGQGLLSSNGDLEEQDGYSIYAGIVFPMPLDARLGIEYNWGSQYWFNFTGAEDSLVASKLAARGQVWEAYYHQPIFKQNFFLTLGLQYYDYEYIGSGNPLGEPVKISELTSLDALNPVSDEVWLGYLSATLRF